jgi:hypothetical protein
MKDYYDEMLALAREMASFARDLEVYKQRRKVLDAPNCSINVAGQERILQDARGNPRPENQALKVELVKLADADIINCKAALERVRYKIAQLGKRTTE